MAEQQGKPWKWLRHFIPDTFLHFLAHHFLWQPFWGWATGGTGLIAILALLKEWESIQGGLAVGFVFCLLMLALSLAVGRARARRVVLVKPEEVEVQGEPQSLADSLDLRRDRMPVRMIARYKVHNPNENVSLPPKEALTAIRQGFAVEYYAGLRRAIDRVLLEVDELWNAREPNSAQVRENVEKAVEEYYKEIQAFPNQSEAKAHRRAWRALVAMCETESEEQWKGGIRGADPIRALREWQKEYKRAKEFWELEN